jgi:HlyD family secretion protein
VQLAETAALELKRREQEAVARRAEIARARAQLAVLDSQLADAEITAPIDGVVLVKSAEPGETVAAGATVVTLGDLDHPWLRGYVNETQLGRVKLNQPVLVATDSFPGKTYRGRVSFIASEAEFTPKQIQTAEERVKLVYRIKVDLPNPNHELKLNMPADARLLVEEAGR